MFVRSRDIELETGLVLAGILVVDLPKGAKVKRQHQRMIDEIIGRLIADARSGQMSADAVIFGWHNNRRPPNADGFVKSYEVQSNWAETRHTIEVKVDLCDEVIGEKLRAALEKVIVGREPILTMVIATRDLVCPHCGEIEGVYFIRQSIWPYCKTHKVSWLAGWDLSLPKEFTEEQYRRYHKIGVNEFKQFYRKKKIESLAELDYHVLDERSER
jgi:hypothetical protein